jgi:hypothetical protein
MSELGQWLPKCHVRLRSDLPSNSDISPLGRDFSKGPSPEVRALFDYLQARLSRECQQTQVSLGSVSRALKALGKRDIEPRDGKAYSREPAIGSS